MMVLEVVKNDLALPWNITTRWRKAIYLTKPMNFLICNIYREGYTCANTLAFHDSNLDEILIVAFCKG